MKKLISFFYSPLVNFIFGLLLYFLLGYYIWGYDSFDKISAFLGGLTVIAIDIFCYGFNALCDKYKKSSK